MCFHEAHESFSTRIEQFVRASLPVGSILYQTGGHMHNLVVYRRAGLNGSPFDFSSIWS